MKRVLHVLAGMDVGGIETWLIHVLRELDPKRIKADFLVHSKEKCFYDDEVEEGGSALIHICPPSNIINYCVQLYLLLRAHSKYDIIHCHLHYFSGLVMCVGWFAGVPIRISHSHLDTREKEAKQSVLRKCYVHLMRFLIRKFTTTGLACSVPAARDLFGNHWKMDNRIHVCFCALNTDRFRTLYDRPEKIIELKKALLIPENSFVVGHIGRFTEQKNHHLLIQIFKNLLLSRTDSHLVLLGEGDLQNEIKNIVERSGITNKVHFCGNQNSVEKYLALMDVFIFPSKWEGLGLVVVEAQAACIPTIVSTAVPPDAIVCKELVERLPLSTKPEEWSKKILAKRKRGDREKAFEQVSKSKFSITNNIEDLLYYWQVDA